LEGSLKTNFQLKVLLGNSFHYKMIRVSNKKEEKKETTTRKRVAKSFSGEKARLTMEQVKKGYWGPETFHP
jgi:hypothetical protein